MIALPYWIVRFVSASGTFKAIGPAQAKQMFPACVFTVESFLEFKEADGFLSGHNHILLCTAFFHLLHLFYQADLGLSRFADVKT